MPKIIKRAKMLKKSTRQRGRSNMCIDKKRKALPPGKRLSKNGKVYYYPHMLLIH